MARRFLGALLTVASLAFSSCVRRPVETVFPRAAPAPVAAPGPRPKLITMPEAVPGKYLIGLAVGADAVEVAGRLRRDAERLGVKATFSPAERRARLIVARLEPRGDALAHAAWLDQTARLPSVEVVEQASVLHRKGGCAELSWGLDRIDQLDGGAPLDGSYSHARSGEGVITYVADDAVETGHEQLESRASRIFPPGDLAPACTHGTGVAGVVAGRTTGAAPRSTIRSLRIYPDCREEGDTEGLALALDWLLQAPAEARPGSILVISSGFCGCPGCMRSCDDEDRGCGGVPEGEVIGTLVAELLGRGVLVVAAAGNEFVPLCACSYPAAIPGVLAVGASMFGTAGDSKWWTRGCQGTNHGPLVALYAPGDAVLVPGVAGCHRDTGTSFAAPLVAGALARMVQKCRPTLAQLPGLVQSLLQAARAGRADDPFPLLHLPFEEPPCPPQ